MEKRKLETNFFHPIFLKEIEKVKLMNRTDTKYWFHICRLQEVLDRIRKDYFILTIDGKSKMPYSTVYFDTSNDRMFTEHHNGKLNRYKVRKRSYVGSGISFLEVKLKNNKGRTIKTRIKSDLDNLLFTTKEKDFLNSITPFGCDDLQPSLVNNFYRITLVNKNFKERCTIDIDLSYETSSKNLSLNNLVIVEIKADGRSSRSPLAQTLRDMRVKSSGFSKYCVGRSLTNHSLKRNRFKCKIRELEKTIQSQIKLYNN